MSIGVSPEILLNMACICVMVISEGQLMVSAETPCASCATVQVQGTIFLVDGQDEPNFEVQYFIGYTIYQNVT